MSLTISPEQVTLAVGEKINFTIDAIDEYGKILQSKVLKNTNLSITSYIGILTNSSRNNPQFNATSPGLGTLIITVHTENDGGVTTFSAQAMITVTGSTVDPVLKLNPPRSKS